jgi:hypothetical protein
MFTKESFDKVQCTDIPKDVLLQGVLIELMGRENMKDTEFDEQLYSGDVFETIASEWNELFEADETYRQRFRISQEMIDQVNNLVEIIDTDLVRIVNN